MVLTCSNCNKELPDDAKFCVECGTPVAVERLGNNQGLDRTNDRKKMVKKLLYAGGFILIGLLGMLFLSSWEGLMSFRASDPFSCTYGVGVNLPTDPACVQRYQNALSFAQNTLPAYTWLLWAGLLVVYVVCFFLLPRLRVKEKIRRLVEKYPYLPFGWLALILPALVLITPSQGGEKIMTCGMEHMVSMPVTRFIPIILF